MTEDIDLRLAELLGAPERAADEAFVARVRRTIMIERRLAEARRRAWRRFAGETAAALAAVATWWLLARVTPSDSEALVPLVSPAAAGLVMLSLLLLVSCARPGTVRPAF